MDRQKPADSDAILKHLPLVAQEVRRRLVLGVPRGVDRSDLESAADEALVVHCARGTEAIRLGIRNALNDLIRHEVMRRRHGMEMPAEITTPAVESYHLGKWEDLPTQQVRALYLVYVEGLTQVEAAKEMKCSQQAVGQLLERAKNKLRADIVKQAA